MEGHEVSVMLVVRASGVVIIGGSADGKQVVVGKLLVGVLKSVALPIGMLE